VQDENGEGENATDGEDGRPPVCRIVLFATSRPTAPWRRAQSERTSRKSHRCRHACAISRKSSISARTRMLSGNSGDKTDLQRMRTGSGDTASGRRGAIATLTGQGRVPRDVTSLWTFGAELES